ncbi:MAG: hypothetical protein ACRECW_10085 [Phyllobacterium sp.]
MGQILRTLGKAGGPKAFGKTFREFLRNRRGSFGIQTALISAPIFLASMAAMDLTNMLRTRENVCNALDASLLAASREYMVTGDRDELQAYGRKFFDANVSVTAPNEIDYTIDFPKNSDPNAQISGTAKLTYQSLFGTLPGYFVAGANWNTDFECSATARLQNTVEVALVLDNSGSMDEYGNSSPRQKRIDLLKSNALKLMDTVFNQSARITRLVDPVRFSIVPFSSAVNVAWEDKNGVAQVDKNTPWMDGGGRSPIHHENFDWSRVPVGTNLSRNNPNAASPIIYNGKTGNQHVDTLGRPITRFTVLENMLVYSGAKYEQFAGWKGCVETRPYPYNVSDTEPSIADPASLFVPMFAPDEHDRPTRSPRRYGDRELYTDNNYWPDRDADSEALELQQDVQKYFKPRLKNAARYLYRSNGVASYGPNASCDTVAIQPLTADRTILTSAINAMHPKGATNVTEGIAWGMRTLSSGVPFTEGRPENERGNDKIMVVLTDGANTYYTPSSLGVQDVAENKSTYSAYGYAAKKQPGDSKSRLTMGTSISTSSYGNSSYGSAMNQQMLKACNEAKTENPTTSRDTIQILVIALDLDAKDDTAMIDDLRTCASQKPSWFTMANGESKLFWNVDSKGADAAFEEIAKLLSVLRITS